MSSCRECIEWNYGGVQQIFSFFHDFKNLKIRQMRVADMYRVAILLRNIYNTMNGGQTARVF